MNSTITLSQLITRLAASTGVDNNSARRFLRAFFASIEKALADGQTVSIKGIGTFNLIGNELNGGKRSVSFIPDESIATEINRPFEMFDAVEIADGVNFSDNAESTSDYAIDANKQFETIDESDKLETIDMSDKIETLDVGDSLVSIDEATSESEPEELTEESVETEEAAEDPTEDRMDSLADRVKTILWPEEEEEKDEEEETRTYVAPVIEPKKPKAITTNRIQKTAESLSDPDHKKLWIWGGIAVVIVSVIAYLAAVFTTPVDPISTEVVQEQNPADGNPENTDNAITEISVDEATPTPSTATSTTPKEEPKAKATPAAKKEPVYDTVEISLIRLAKKHYGEGSYWVFIYDANRNIISNPNKIRPGQKVVIPDRSTLPGNSIAETKAIAKKKQSEILDKFK